MVSLCSLKLFLQPVPCGYGMQQGWAFRGGFCSQGWVLMPAFCSGEHLRLALGRAAGSSHTRWIHLVLVGRSRVRACSHCRMAPGLHGNWQQDQPRLDGEEKKDEEERAVPPCTDTASQWEGGPTVLSLSSHICISKSGSLWSMNSGRDGCFSLLRLQKKGNPPALVLVSCLQGHLCPLASLELNPMHPTRRGLFPCHTHARVLKMRKSCRGPLR